MLGLLSYELCGTITEVLLQNSKRCFVFVGGRDILLLGVGRGSGR